MKKRHILIASASLIVIVVIAGSTVAFLKYLGGAKSDNTITRPEDKPKENPAAEGPKEDIDEEKNKQATAIENEATSLMESNPSEAHQKYLDAENAYLDANNMSKVGEMRANALTAQAQVEAGKTPQ